MKTCRLIVDGNLNTKCPDTLLTCAVTEELHGVCALIALRDYEALSRVAKIIASRQLDTERFLIGSFPDDQQVQSRSTSLAGGGVPLDTPRRLHL